MATQEEAAAFLKAFFEKKNIFGIVYLDNRPKNTQTLIDLDLSSNARGELIDQLKDTDYSEGPNKDNVYHGADMWVFGKVYKRREIYIKITMGVQNSSTLCVSFHLAEHPMSYPYK